ncbi:RdlA protein [Streptomyces agglomeratus]|uniref:rodlin n=1 Tax=Streptomyces agglomeratus TaxID=285458 RepID=UPI0008543EF5|nr:rodlin [Streptomyces agglomeratus]OEJ40032.1 RdlA protein [Streptomyces agglomeratus]OEJ45588.1 RdlA protein [Streptomyces agglomeratus]
MLKKMMATAAVAASVVGFGAAGAGQAIAAGDDQATANASGNGSVQKYGNSITKGKQSPQLSIIQGTLNKPCVTVPVKNLQNVLIINIGVQDILSNPQEQQCAESSSQNKDDETLSHVLDNAIAANGAENN